MEEKQKTKRNGKGLKILTIILVVVLITMIGFFGIYTQKQNRMEDVVKGYSLAMDLGGSRIVSIKPEEVTKTTIKDSEGNVIEEELTDEEINEKGYTKEEKDENAEKVTKENIEKTKQYILKRLKRIGVQNYIIKTDDQTGEITLELEENDDTDEIVSNVGTTGKFEIVDSESQEVLMTNDDIKSVDVMYSTLTNGTSVYMVINFNNDGKQKFQDVTEKYKTVENKTDENTTTEEGTENETAENETTDNELSDDTKEEQKQIALKIDGQDMMTTSFDEVITTGKLSLSIGQPSTKSEVVNSNAKRVQRMAAMLEDGPLPIDYEVNGNEYVLSDIETSDMQKIILGFIIVSAILLLILIFKYKLNGLLSSISFIGGAALLLILLRYTNVILSIEGLFGIAIVLFINYLLITSILKNIKEKENEQTVLKIIKKTYGSFFLKVLPIYIMAVVFCFIDWLPIANFGMVIFWGLLLMALYNFIITVPMLKLREEDK